MIGGFQVPNPGSAAQAEALFGSLSPKKVGTEKLARSVSFSAFHQRAENSRCGHGSYRDHFSGFRVVSMGRRNTQVEPDLH